MTDPLIPQDRSSFYGAAVIGLRALDARDSTPRRFGPDAEARWTQFAGALGVGDRIDILLRDAAGIWGAAFSPSECFGFFGLANDEPFGPDWSGIDDHSAKRLLAEPDPHQGREGWRTEPAPVCSTHGPRHSRNGAART
jgi:hypothetical protein